MEGQQKPPAPPRHSVASSATNGTLAGLQLGPLANDEPRSRQYRRYLVRLPPRGLDHGGGGSLGSSFAAQHQPSAPPKAQSLPGLEHLEALYAELCKLRLLSQARKTDIEIMERNLREVYTPARAKSPHAPRRPPPLPPRSSAGISPRAPPPPQPDSSHRPAHNRKGDQQNGHNVSHSTFGQNNINHGSERITPRLSLSSGGHDSPAAGKVNYAGPMPRNSGPEKLVLKLKMDPNHNKGTKRPRSPEYVPDGPLQVAEIPQALESLCTSPTAKRKRKLDSDDTYTPPSERPRASPPAERRSSSQASARSPQNTKKRKGLPLLETHKKKAKSSTPPPPHAQRPPSAPPPPQPAAGSSPQAGGLGFSGLEAANTVPDNPLAREPIPKVKAGSQVPIHTFYASIEPYFRPLTEDDIRLLEVKEEEDPSLYQIPQLGKAISESQTVTDDTFSSPFQSATSMSAGRTEPGSSRKTCLTGGGVDPSSEQGASPTAFAGPLTARIFCSFLEEPDKEEERLVPPASAPRVTIKVEPDVEDYNSIVEDERELFGSAKEQQAARESAVLFEKRLMEELRFIGLLDDEPIDWKAREDDEVAAKLRELQEELREQTRVNRERRALVARAANEHMGYQEYLSVLDELDNKVESAFAKRYRPTKGTGKKKKALQNMAHSMDHAVAAVDRRRKLITHVGVIFQPAERFSLPERSIFEEPRPPPAQ